MTDDKCSVSASGEWCVWMTWLFCFSDSTSAPDHRQMRLRCRSAWELDASLKDSTSSRSSVLLSRDVVVVLVDVDHMSVFDKPAATWRRPFRSRRSRPDNRPMTARIVIGLRRDPDSIEPTWRGRIVSALATGTRDVRWTFPDTETGTRARLDVDWRRMRGADTRVAGVINCSHVCTLESRDMIAS